MKKSGIIIALVLVATLVFSGCNLFNTVSDIADGEMTFFSSNDGEGSVHADDPGHITYVAEKNEGEVTINGQKYVPKENVVNVLLIGVDSDASRVKQKMGWRGDMLMLATLDFNDNSVTLTSIPRDTRTEVHKLDENGNIKDTVSEKINHAYAYGGGPTKFSAENEMVAVSDFLEVDQQLYVPIDYYISIDLEGVPSFASAVDGVEVTLDQRVPGVGGKGETVTLSGSTARKFLENRYDMDDGETARQRHEQQFMMSLISKIKDMGAVDSAANLYDSFLKYMRTNLTLDQVKTFAGLVDNMSIDEIQFNVMTQGKGEIVSDAYIWYYLADDQEVLDMMLGAMYNPA